MIVKVEKRENPYVLMDVGFLNDNRLTARAKGILAYLLSKPANWQVRIYDLENKFADGKNAIKAGLKELVQNGYAEIVKLRGEGGKLMGSSYLIRETPTDSTDSRGSAKPKVGKTESRENAPLSNIENLDIIEEKENNDSFFAPSNEVAYPEPLEAKQESKPTKQKKAKEKTAHEAYTPLCELFHEFYLEKKGEPYTGFNGRQGKELNELIKKAEKKLAYINRLTENYAPAPADVVAYLENVLKNNTSAFFQNNLTISTFNTQFDTITVSVPKTAQNLGEKALKIKDILCEVFSLTKEQTFNVGLLNEFLAHFQNTDHFKHVLTQCWYYSEYAKKQGKQFVVDLSKFIGTPEKNYENGKWNACQWKEKLESLNVKH